MDSLSQKATFYFQDSHRLYIYAFLFLKGEQVLFYFQTYILMTSVRDKFNETKIVPSQNDGSSKGQHKKFVVCTGKFCSIDH